MLATMERVSYPHSTDDGPKSPKPVCYLIKELTRCWCRLVRAPIQFKPNFSELVVLHPFITGYEPRTFCNRPNRRAKLSIQRWMRQFPTLRAQVRSWVQWLQIEIQPTTAANLE